MCQSIFDTISSRQLEATYQRCLKMDLEECGVEVIEEVALELVYKGKKVGTRRADLVLETSNKERAIVELKAVSGSLSKEHLKQLEYYMYHFRIHTGYLINFPHDSLFPDIPDDSSPPADSSSFSQSVLCGMPDNTVISDSNTRGANATSVVQIVKVVRNFGSGSPSKTLSPRTNATTTSYSTPKKNFSTTPAAVTTPPPSMSSPVSGSPICGVLTTKGTPCTCRKPCGYHAQGDARCGALTSKGTPCKCSKPCRFHPGSI